MEEPYTFMYPTSRPLEKIAEEYRQLKEDNARSDNHINEIEKQKKKRCEDLEARHSETLDAEIEKYLLLNGFEKIERLPFHKDILRNITRYLRKNPLYISKDGHAFLMNSKKYIFMKYEKLIHPFQIIKDVRLSENDKFELEVIKGLGLGALIGSIAGYIIGAKANPIESMPLGVGACVGLIIGPFYVLIPEIIKSLFTPERQEYTSGKYEAIEKLVESVNNNQ